MQIPNERTLILLSCSRDKNSGGTRFPTKGRQFSKCLINQKKEFIQKRKNILDYLLYEREYRIHAPDSCDGYRDERISNSKLVRGPDFGYDSTSDEVYLPANQRYVGRFFNGLLKASPRFWEDLFRFPVEILFVSALYGFLFWDESIQNYDCHLSDYIVEPDSKKKVRKLKKYWKDPLTNSLCEFLDNSKNDWPIISIYNLLSEESYQDAIGWDRVAKKGVDILHRKLKESNDSQNLYDLGKFLGSNFTRFLPNSSNPFEVGKWNEINEGIPICFERIPILSALDFKMQVVKEQYPFGAEVSEQTLRGLAEAEISLERLKSEKQTSADIDNVVLNFAKVVEGYLRSTIPGLEGLTIGKMVELEKERLHQVYPDLPTDLCIVRDLRNKAAHEESYREKSLNNLNLLDTQKSKNLTYKILQRSIKSER